MPSGIGSSYKGYESRGKHLATGSEYPDSPCGSGDHKNYVYRIKDITCPACKQIMLDRAKRIIKIIGAE